MELSKHRHWSSARPPVDEFPKSFSNKTKINWKLPQESQERFDGRASDKLTKMHRIAIATVFRWRSIVGDRTNHTKSQNNKRNASNHTISVRNEKIAGKIPGKIAHKTKRRKNKRKSQKNNTFFENETKHRTSSRSASQIGVWWLFWNRLTLYIGRRSFRKTTMRIAQITWMKRQRTESKAHPSSNNPKWLIANCSSC